MRPKFDLFARLANGTPMLIGSFDDLEQARDRLKALARNAVGDCFIYSEEKGTTELIVRSGDETQSSRRKETESKSTSGKKTKCRSIQSN